MFTDYEMTRAFVAERQETLRHEARQHHLSRIARRGRRRTAHRGTASTATPVDLPRRASSDASDRMAA